LLADNASSSAAIPSKSGRWRRAGIGVDGKGARIKEANST